VNEIVNEHDEDERKRRERRERNLRERAQLTATLKPDRVPIKHALVLAGNMSRARFYELAAKGVFDIYKEGVKSTVGVESIDRYNASLPPSQVSNIERYNAERLRAKIGKQRTAT
jgi:hypothetical protein